MAKITPAMLARPNTESAHQRAYFCALSEMIVEYPDVRWVHAIPNGGDRNRAVAANMVAEGVKGGVWDIHIPLARHGSIGMYIEMKHPRYRMKKGFNLSANQKAFYDHLCAERYSTAICFTWEEALAATKRYLGIL